MWTATSAGTRRNTCRSVVSEVLVCHETAVASAGVGSAPNHTTNMSTPTHGRVAQRWAHDAPALHSRGAAPTCDNSIENEEADADEARKLRSRTSQPSSSHHSTAVCNSWRVLAEGALCLLVLSWLVSLLFFWSSSSCSEHTGSRAMQTRTGHSQHALVSQYTGLAITVDPTDSTLFMSERNVDEPSSAQHFNIEWLASPPSTGPAFCLRSLRDLRLVEVALPGEPAEHTLRLGRYGCDSAEQMFSLSGRSLYSLGARSIINIREHIHVRAHSDVGPPWKPMHYETSRSMLHFEPLALPARQLEGSLLGLVATLEQELKRAGKEPRLSKQATS